MTSLLRADLSRVFKHRSVVYTMFIVLLIIALLYAVFVPILQDVVNNAAETASELGESAGKRGFDTPLHFGMTALLLFGNVGFLACWACTSVAWADARSGYDRTIISSVGKRVYYREKFVFSAIVSAVFTFGVTIIGSVASGIVSGYASLGSIPELILWCLMVSIISWACACVSLVILWYTRNSTIAYIAGFVLCTGLLSSVLSMVIGNISVDLAETWSEVCKWLPTGTFNSLSAISDGHLDLSNENMLRDFIPPVVLLFVSYHLAFRNLTKRDI